MITRRRLLALAAAGGISSAHALMAGEPPDSAAARVDPNRPGSPFAGVGSVVFGGGVYSGVLIAARYVLTAGHVALGARGAGPLGTVFNVCVQGDRPEPIDVVRAIPHPEFHQVDLASLRFDIGLLELAHDAPAAARRYVIYRGPVVPGTPIWLAGYGASGHGSHEPTVGADPAVKRVGANLIDQVQRDPEHGRPRAYLFTFDPPPENRPEHSRSLGNAIETGLAGGDSGSPAFVGPRDRLQLLGINSLVARSADSPGALSTYGTLCGGAIAAAHLDWIAQVTAA